jgi:hypothetical protein
MVDAPALSSTDKVKGSKVVYVIDLEATASGNK